jgi:hypothetical protein
VGFEPHFRWRSLPQTLFLTHGVAIGEKLKTFMA